jgi:hypothetical protein
MLTQRSVEQTSRKADRAMRLNAIYQDARDWVGEEQSEERRYRFEGSYAVRLTHDAAEKRLAAALQKIRRLDSSPTSRAAVAQLTDLHQRYATRATGSSPPSTPATTPPSSTTTTRSSIPSSASSRTRLAPGRRAQEDALCAQRRGARQGARATRAITVAFGAGLALLASFAASSCASAAASTRRGPPSWPACRRSPSPTR